MIRMTGLDCAVMFNLIQTHTDTHTHTHTHMHNVGGLQRGSGIDKYYLLFISFDASHRKRFS